MMMVTTCMLQQTLGVCVCGISLVSPGCLVLGVMVGKHVVSIQQQHDSLAEVFAVRYASLTAATPEVLLQAALNACLVHATLASRSNIVLMGGFGGGRRCDLLLLQFWRRRSPGRSTRWLAAGPADLPCSSSARRPQWPSTPLPLSFLAGPTCCLHSNKHWFIHSFIHQQAPHVTCTQASTHLSIHSCVQSS